ncbi:adenylate/guanylate cyclase domain-containing protein [Rhodovibrionaceae bacterium A322]
MVRHTALPNKNASGFTLQADNLPAVTDSMSAKDAVTAVNDWLMDQVLGEATGPEMIEGAMVALKQAGFPISRGFFAFKVLHPLFDSISLIWRDGQGVSVESHVASETGLDDGYLNSPQVYLINQAQKNGMEQAQTLRLRRRMVGEEALLDFDMVKDLAAEGMTDYLAFVVVYDVAREKGLIGSWTTDHPDGFADEQLAQLRRFESRLAVALKARSGEAIAQNLVDTYLGPEAGQKVLQGGIKRGDSQTIEAVIWYSDLRESTALSECLSPKEFLELLDSYFECTAGAALEEGGEVLTMIGDAVLAIFPYHRFGSAKAAAEAALKAAGTAWTRALETSEQRRRDGKLAFRFGLGLHVGDLLYGNIGVPERLQFTAVGPNVNETARLEGLTRPLERCILASGDFAALLPEQEWEDKGSHELRGLLAPVPVFAPVLAQSAALGRDSLAPS